MEIIRIIIVTVILIVLVAEIGRNVKDEFTLLKEGYKKKKRGKQ